MIIQILGSEGEIRKCVSEFSNLPSEFIPKYFSENETGIDKKNNIFEYTDKFCDFIEENPLGYFLHAKSSTVDVSLSGDKSSLFFDVKMKIPLRNVDELLCFFAKRNVTYGYACDWDERKYRNLIVKQIGNSKIHQWVGRSVNHHLPGLYWCNLISKNLIENFIVDKDNIINNSLDVKYFDTGTVVIKMFDEPLDWESYAPILDSICEVDAGIFSKWEVFDAIDSTDNQNDFFKKCLKYP